MTSSPPPPLLPPPDGRSEPTANPSVASHLLASIAVMCVSAAASSAPFALKSMMRHSMTRALLAGFSGGVLVGVAFLHLLDDSQQALYSLSNYPFANLCFVGGAALVAVIDSMTARAEPVAVVPASASSTTIVHLGGDEALQRGAQRRAYAIQAAVCVHSVLHGISFRSERSHQLVLDSCMFGVHQVLQGIALGVVAVEAELPALSAAFCVALYTLAFPLSVACALAAGSRQLLGCGVKGVLGGFAGGALMCVACVDMVPLGRAHKSQWNLKVPKVAAAFVGIGLMAAVAMVD